MLQKILVGERDQGQKRLQIVNGHAIDLNLTRTGSGRVSRHIRQQMRCCTSNMRNIGKPGIEREYPLAKESDPGHADPRKEESQMAGKT
jgi:hypothetical protein